ncbi:MAG TPA: SEC-C metal-binding domain-containing protein [Candidatus Angelobacter sp.]|nr:SEC-C metal-binding domain-containing protein [Candidatus Angelobacter sp.]
MEKLGRNDLCPCGSGRKFQEVLPQIRLLRRLKTKLL